MTTNSHCISDTEMLASANPGLCVFTGYGFVDFDSPAAAQKAVASLKANGVQAQMAKVGTVFQFCFITFFFCDRMFFHSYEMNWNWSLWPFGLCLLGRNKKPHCRLGLEESGWFISSTVCVYVLMFSFIMVTLLAIQGHLWNALFYPR